MDVLTKTETKFLPMHCMISAARPTKQYFKKSWKPQRCRENTGLIRSKYAETPKIEKSKYDDLQALKAVLPQDCHAFYGLPHCTS